jgi:hypothetical protein
LLGPSPLDTETPILFPTAFEIAATSAWVNPGQSATLSIFLFSINSLQTAIASSRFLTTTENC